MPRKDAVWLNLQVSEEEKTRLTDYAHWCGKSRVDVLREFIQTLPVIEHMQLSEADTQVFLAALEKPPEPNEKLKQLMQTKAPWERNSVITTKEEIRPWLESLVAQDDQLQQLSARVEQMNTTLQGLKELAGMHQTILEEIGRMMEQANGRPN